MTGLIPFSLEKTDCFERTFKKRSPSRNRIPGLRRALAFRELAKSKAYSKGFASDISKVLKDMLDEPYPISSRDEPLPGGTSIPWRTLSGDMSPETATPVDGRFISLRLELEKALLGKFASSI